MTVPVVIHPGEMLREEFLAPMGLSAEDLATHTGIPKDKLGQLIDGQVSVDETIDHKLCAHFGLSAGWWLRLQALHDGSH